jgi:phosphoglycolate phosphatase
MRDGRGTVIFDLDGTLVDSAPDLADALDTLLFERGLVPLGLDHVRGLIGHGVAELVRKGLAVRGVRLADDDQSQAVQRFLQHYTKNLSRRSRPYPGVVEGLRDLRQAGWRMVVCTNKLEASARGLLADLDLLSGFALVAGPDTFGVAKPDPAHLLRCLPDGWRDGGVVMVGDSVVDVQAARAARLPVVAVRWGYGGTALQDSAPDAFADSFDDVLAAIAALAAPRETPV